MRRKWVGYLTVVIFLVLGFSNSAYSQERSEDEQSYKPLLINLNEEGSQYVRFIMWHQMWLNTNNLSASNVNLQVTPSIRRSRYLIYAKLSPKILFLTHFGLNSLSTENLTSLGNNGDGPQLFLHGAWGEFQVSKGLSVGGGLHYWNGLTRLSSQSTLNFMTLDQSRPFTSWHSLGVTDQFARHLGIYAKGQVGNFDYRLAINSPLINNLGAGKDYGIKDSGLSYSGVSHMDKNGQNTGNTIVEGYFRYNLLDQESITLPYQVGTYLGEKKVLGIGTGFFFHPDGMYNTSSSIHENVFHFAADLFMEMPIEEGAIHLYASYIDFNYGENYVSRWAGTGSAWYGQLGYYFSPFKVMPYLAYNLGNYDGFGESIHSMDVGINYFIKGHNAKITLEYHNIKGDIRETSIPTFNDRLTQLRLQMQLFI
jgi:hypothetical protein